MGYQAELLAAVCEVFLTARAAGALAPKLKLVSKRGMARPLSVYRTLPAFYLRRVERDTRAPVLDDS